MKIFCAEPDFDNYSYYLIDSPIRLYEYTSDQLLADPPQIHLELFKGKTKKEKSRSHDFNSSTFSMFLFVINEQIKEKLSFIKEIQFIETITDDNRKFFFVNPLTLLDSIAINNEEQLSEMISTRKYYFRKEIDYNKFYLFRDKTFSSEIFFSERFIDEFSHLFTGVKFVPCNRETE